MHFFSIGLFLAAFQVTCHSAPEHHVETLVEKRAVCTAYQLDKNSGCSQWVAAGYCDPSSQFHYFMQVNCYASCGNCEVPPSPALQRCTDDQLDKSSSCSQWVAAKYCAQSSRYHQFMQENCYASCGNCEVPPTPIPRVDLAACLQAHNAKRALHQDTPALVWDSTLTQHAQAWADYLAATGKFEHDETRPAGEGENLYWAADSTVKTCADAVESWYSEIKKYNYNIPGFSLATGHFTQVVWTGTTHLGAALKKIVNSKGQTETYIVARYSPTGNVHGQFADNVKPLN